MFSNHLNFWAGEKKNKLIVLKHIIKKLSLFQLLDPHITHLTRSSGSAKEILCGFLVDHINKVRRTRKLESRAQENYGLDEEELDFSEEDKNGGGRSDED